MTMKDNERGAVELRKVERKEESLFAGGAIGEGDEPMITTVQLESEEINTMSTFGHTANESQEDTSETTQDEAKV